MTGYTVHTGSSLKFSQGWDQIFQRKKSAAAAPDKAKSTKKATKKGTAKPAKSSSKGVVKKVASKKAASKKVKRGN